MTTLNDGATTVFLVYNPSIPEDAQQLPFTVYESALSEGDADQQNKFIQLECGVETGEAERIAVDGITMEGSGDADPTGRGSAEGGGASTR